jgi:hypothetical protein
MDENKFSEAILMWTCNNKLIEICITVSEMKYADGQIGLLIMPSFCILSEKDG